MNEIERIIKNKIISKDFLEEERKCNFYITSNKKKIWAIELDLLVYFDKFCKNNNLQYFLAYGSLLGAVRHNGFIPWDDDIDIFMFRNDYNNLIKLNNKIIYPYFLQNHITESKSFWSHSKLRNSETTCINKRYFNREINFGLDIDIFPLDNIELKNNNEVFSKINELNIENSKYMEKEDCDNKAHINWLEIQRMAQLYNNIDSMYIANNVFTLYDNEKSVYKKEWFKETIMMKFENYYFPVPIGYKDILKKTYGDYMKYPPINEKENWHSRNYIDTEKPYYVVKKEIKY